MKCLVLLGCIAVLCGVSWSALGPCDNSKPKSCECIESNFTIDLAKLGQKLEGKNITVDPNGDQQKYGKYTFLLSLCNPIVCNFTKGAPGTMTAAACQYNPDQDLFSNLGQQTTLDWAVDPADDVNFNVMYNKGDPIDTDKTLRQTKVQFTIDDSVKEPKVFFVSEDIGSDKVHTYVFTVTLSSKLADSGLGGSIAGVAGLVIMLLLILGIAAYCIIGSVVMFKVKGARGAEVIPNYSFWKELPIYIKDGFLFTISPCRRKFGKGYQSL